METQHVHYYLAVCKELNLTRAAKLCGIAQPSLTAAMQRLEQQVGGALFLRSTRPPYVQLTDLGRELLPIFIKIDELIRRTSGLLGNIERKRRRAPKPRTE